MTTDKEIVTVREACRRRMPLDGVDAQALEHALTITERERNTARTEGETLRKELSQMRALDKVDCAAMRMTLKGLEGDKDRLERERDNARESLKEVAEDRDTQVKAASGYSTDAYNLRQELEIVTDQLTRVLASVKERLERMK